MPTKSLQYLRPDSTQTLREGIQELRKAESPETDASETMPPELLDDIEVHDAIHVLFACPTNLEGEIIAHVWTAFGTTVRMRDMQRVNRHQDHRAVLVQIGHRKLLGTWFRSLPRILKTIRRARRMTQRWPVEELDAHLGRQLRDLRQEFRICPLSFRDSRGSGGAALRSIRQAS